MTIEAGALTEDHLEDMLVPLCTKKETAVSGFERVDALKERSVLLDIMLNELERKRRKDLGM